MKLLKEKSIIWLLSIALLMPFFVKAQDTKTDSSYQFTLVKQLPYTPVKNQFRSGTCWSFSAISFIESELLRKGKGEYDLSEMFCVRDAYEKKAEKYLRMGGTTNFSGGGEFHDVIHTLRDRGLMPEEAYPGLDYGEKNHVHGELDAVAKAYMDALIKNPNKKISTAWMNGFKGIMDAYLGHVPENFVYKDKLYTSRSFAESLGLHSEDYVCLTSFTHHPFYKTFILEVPDNWAWGEIYNVPLDELMEIIDYALDKGYTVGWASDVSEKGFAYNKGVAVIPETDVTELSGAEKARWEKLTEKERNSQMYNLDRVVPEKKVTQEMRQKEFDNLQTTDDHGMHIVGYGNDQFGHKYYYVKNSWGGDNKFNGFFYASVPFVRLKTIDILVHKEAIPTAIKKKLGI
ncbi:MAG TPA: C1 family peptidase [Bacteroidales bacterium]|jgi:bleomycin hydrolase|nr:aminopeptidase [Bacteroidales bacterium]MDI9574239.1 C1 family peptidase [Bacteroidota bacterium]OQC60475.1 MAG: Peptidase C1-like family protein [Bacteroidetes bacterium ADurb.Bin012]MBP9512449.1 aminopeptidase [Bacteroidales bacterium]MBP9588943.1 aminopeptidase [Bacteroidales bacterium]